MKIPQQIQIGGQTLVTQMCEELGGKLGKCCVFNGYIKIATSLDGAKQTESSMFNTYVHECVHAILDTMGRSDLSQDESFVCAFSSFATEGLVSIFRDLAKKEAIKIQHYETISDNR